MQFVTIQEDINTIWILLSGKVKALEEYSTGKIYIFQKFSAPEVFGEMEALSDIPYFRASLITETKCVFITVPVSVYLDFLRNHSEYLYKRTKVILKRVLDAERDNMMYLMLEGIDRIKLYFIQHYELSVKGDICILKITRQQIAEETGLSVRTVNRVIKKLKEQDLLKVKKQKIIITEKQYNSMVESVDEILGY